ncbi:MAG: porin [Gammaproteobacteria bacterium]
MRNLTRGLTIIGLLTTGGVASAADLPSAKDLFDSWGVAFSGYVDGQYEYSSSPSPSLHVFDARHDSFVLNQAAFTLAAQPKEGWGGVVNVIAGEDARLINLFSSPSSTNNFDVTQAFIQYATGSWTIQGGKMLTLAGAEVIAPTLNTNVSRSLLFNAEPFTHTGLRATYAASDKVSVIFGVNNGWNETSDNNSQKTAEVGISLTPSKAFTLTAQGYFGSEPVGNGLNGEKDLVDLVATWNVTDAASFMLNYDWGKQDNVLAGGGDAKWYGVAGYFNYAFNSLWRMSLRAEYFDDKDGYTTGAIQKVKEVTATFGYAASKNFELRFEGRYDKSDEDFFLKDTSGKIDDNQTGVLVEGVFKF